MQNLSPEGSHYRELADRAKASFAEKFWNEQESCLFDVIDGDARDASVRPNQIFAVSLHHKIAPEEWHAPIAAAVERELLTPFGLRTLSPRDPQYQGRYGGGPASRDAAYHQGTVWPWLMGPFIRAYLAAHGRGADTLEHCKGLIAPLIEYMNGEGTGQLPEIFDGDAPQRPRGCFAQAWSVAGLRQAMEDLNAA
jgi:glycogen debranching enzyme